MGTEEKIRATLKGSRTYSVFGKTYRNGVPETILKNGKIHNALKISGRFVFNAIDAPITNVSEAPVLTEAMKASIRKEAGEYLESLKENNEPLSIEGKNPSDFSKKQLIKIAKSVGLKFSVTLSKSKIFDLISNQAENTEEE